MCSHHWFAWLYLVLGRLNFKVNELLVVQLVQVIIATRLLLILLILLQLLHLH